MMQSVSSIYYTILYYITTNKIITSTYQLNSGRKYRSSCHHSCIMKERARIYKIQTLVIISIHVLYWYITLINNKLLHQLTC